MREHKPLFGKTPIVSCSKGIIVETGQLISQVVKEELPDSNYAVLSGPSFAEEMMKQCISSPNSLVPTVVVVASENDKTG